MEAACVVGLTTLVATIVYLLQALVICTNQSKALAASQAFDVTTSLVSVRLGV